MLRPSFSHQRGARVPFATHAQPHNEPEHGEHYHTRCKAGRKRTYRISQDAHHQCTSTSYCVSDESEHHSADSAGEQCKSIQQPSCGFRHVQVRHHMRQHQGVEHHVECIEPPSEGCSQQCAPLRTR